MGRPKGSKNKKSNHKAGGDRKSKKFQNAKEEKAKRSHEYFLSRRHQNDPSSAKSPHPMEEAIFKISKELMAEVLDHPSMPKGKFVPNQGTVDFTSGNAWEVKYDEDDDDRSANGIGDYGIGASSDDDKSSASSTRYRQSYTPSQGTPLYNYLMEVQGKIIDDENCQQQKFIHPSKSPLASGLGKSPNPSNFYKDVVVRVWIPDAQFKSLHYKYKCPSCQSDSINTKHQGSWRPAIANGDIHWVFFFYVDAQIRLVRIRLFLQSAKSF
ncbi:unnamed protein product [Cylindrotheca closterium]|uniref:Uncharacterized protein n=1 Tax=Cylindrotheca closterium TaxID=2856 RepID=A0AAD2G6D9_9STRA|nr:unnamed protein product [Cylindrotheca closterium]